MFTSSTEDRILDRFQGARKVIVEELPEDNAYLIRYWMERHPDREVMEIVPKSGFSPERLAEHGFEEGHAGAPGKRTWIRRDKGDPPAGGF